MDQLEPQADLNRRRLARRCTRATWLVPCVALLVACTGTSHEAQPIPSPSSPASTEPSPTTAADGPPAIRVESPLVADLWRPFDELRRLETSLPDRLDFAAIRAAPPLHTAPIDAALMAVGTNPGAYQVGEVAVMSPSREWRIVDRRALGMRNPEIVEQQFRLSPDGRLLALGDERGIWVVDVSTAQGTRVPIALQDPVIHGWLDGGVVFSRRGGGTPALDDQWLADPRSGKVTSLGFDPWSSAVSPDGRVVELLPPASDKPAHVPVGFSTLRVWRDGEPGPAIALERRLSGAVFVGHRGSSWVAAVQGANWGRRWSPTIARGMAAIDPASGDVVGLVQLPREQTMWTKPLGPLGREWILLDSPFGPGGGILAWNPMRRQLRGVTEIDEQGAVVSLADGLVGVVE